MDAFRNGCETPMIEIHEFAELFPLSEGQPLWDLADDIKANGQQEPIAMYQGKILDGRRRELACARAKVDPWRKEWKGTDAEALAFVVSKNLHRRHLGEADRAKVAAKIATMKVGNPQISNENPIGAAAPIGKTLGKQHISTANAAEMMNVSPDAVKKAKKVIKKGTHAVQNAVDDGTITLTDAAKVADAPAEIQESAVEAVRSGKAKTATEAAGVVVSMTDAVGFEVPEKLYAAFGAEDKIAALCRQLDKISEQIEELGRAAGGRMIHVASHKQSIKSIRQSLWGSRPTHVCPYCRATKDDCTGCKGRGWTTKTYFDQAPAEKRKAMEAHGV